MKWCSLLFFCLALTMGGIAHAQDVAVELQKTDCALTDGKITAGDGTLCENDIAFGMIYEMLPSIINELIPFWSLEHFDTLGDEPNKPTLLGEYNGDKIFITLFNLFYELVFYCILLYLSLVAFSFMVRWLRGEPTTENQSGKDTPRSFFAGAALGGSFLIPYKNFFVGQVVIFTLGIAALSLANFVFSLFLSSNQQLLQAPSSAPQEETQLNSPRFQERHDFHADAFYRYLTRMQICRSQSTEYILSGEGGRFAEPADYNKLYRCASAGGYGEQRSLLLQDSTNAPLPFVHRSRSMSVDGHGMDIMYSGVDKILFASRNENASMCQIEGEAAPDYECGGVQINQIDWASNPLVRLLVMENPSALRQHMNDLQSQLNANLPPSSVESIVTQRWELFKRDLESALETAWVSAHGEADDGLIAVNNEATFRKTVVESAMKGNSRRHFQGAAQLFHRAAMNIIMFGQRFGSQETNTFFPDEDEVLGDSNWEPLEYRMTKAKEFADLIAKVQCKDYSYHHEDAEITAKFLRGEIAFLPGGAHAKCLDVESKQVIEYIPGQQQKPIPEIREDATSRIEELKTELVEAWSKEVEKLAGQRRAIEASFSASVNDEDAAEWWVTLRQKGYLAAGDYALNINDRVASYKRDVKQLVNNYSLSSPNYNESYVSNALLEGYTQNDIFYSFEKAGDQIFSQTRLPKGYMDPLIANASWVAEQENVMRETPTGVDSTDFLSNFQLDMSYLDRLGIGLKEGDKDEEECLSDPTKCPFPLSDPIIELSLMGHDMVDAAISFFVVAIPVKMITSPTAEKVREGLYKRNSQIRSGDRNTLRQSAWDSLKKAPGFLGGLMSLLDKVARPVAVILDMIYDALSTVMLIFLALGAMLAYLLPLLPKIFLYMKFISWLMVLVMSSFSVLLWTLFWVRFKEKRDLLKQAGMHYGVELMFSPTFSLISVLFAWYFFYVIAYGVGVGLSWVWELPLYQSGWLRPYFDTMVVVSLVIFVYVVGLRYAYELMSDMTGELLKKLGVANSKQKDKVNDIIKAFLFDKVLGDVKQANEKMSKKTGADATRAHLNNRQEKAQALNDAYQAGYDAVKNKAKGAQNEK